MAPITVLSNKDVHKILHSLTRDDVLAMQKCMAEALHEYSTGNQEGTAGCSSNQPQRISVPSKGGRTTLFMPAQTGDSTGVKIVSLTAPGSEKKDDEGDQPDLLLAASSFSSSSRTSFPRRSATNTSASSGSTGGVSLAAAFGEALPASVSSLPSVSSSSSSFFPTSIPTTASTATLSTPSSSHNAIDASTSSLLSPSSTTSSSTTSTTPLGCLALLSASTGAPTALLNAHELTAFRTALAATLLFKKRTRVHSLCVFGAGRQAYWHIRLALLLRGHDMHHVRIINRSFSGAEQLLQAIYLDANWTALRHAHCSPKLDFSVLSPDYGEYARLLKEHVRDADAIFCCTPSTTPLFPAEFLTSSEGRRKARYLSLIGSYKPHMLEVDPAVLAQAATPDAGHHHHHRHADRGAGVVVVDGLEACLKEAGEIIQAGLKPDHLVELGEIIMVKRAAGMKGEEEEGLVRWLEGGNVVYKSVGLGLMDLAVGAELVRLAGERGVGVTLNDF